MKFSGNMWLMSQKSHKKSGVLEKQQGGSNCPPAFLELKCLSDSIHHTLHKKLRNLRGFAMYLKLVLRRV